MDGEGDAGKTRLRGVFLSGGLMEFLVKPSPFRRRKSLEESPPAKKKYGCLMAVIDGEVAASVQAWARGNIPESELGKDGYGDEPHVTCFLPGQELQGRVVAGSKARYSGKAVKLVTASGVALSVTPNHPVLTTEGFVPAGQIKKGQHLLGYVGEDVPPITDDNKQHAPALVEEVFESLTNIARPVFVLEEEVSAFDFHGDAEFFQGDVQVVRPRRMLRRDWVADVAKNFNQGEFSRRGWREGFLSPNGDLGFMFRSLPSPPFGPGCVQKERPLFFDRHASKPCFGRHSFFGPSFVGASSNCKGLTVVPKDNTCLSQTSVDHHATQTVLPSQLSGGQPFFVLPAEFDDQGFWQDDAPGVFEYGPASELDVPLDKSLPNGRSASFALASNLCDRFPGKVHLNEVVAVEVFHYDGPVYDFESPLGYIVVNHTVVSNCLYGFEDDKDALEKLRKVVAEQRPFSIRLKNLTSFEDRGDGAPLIVNVYSPELYGLNTYIKQSGEFQYVTKFPKYIPHLTVAYVLPECVEKYKELETSFTERWVEVTHMVYSTADRVKTVLPLGVSGGKALTPREERTNRQREYFKQRLDGLNQGRQAGRIDPDDTSLSQEDLELETGAESSNEPKEKTLSSLDGNLGGALVPPPARGLLISPFRNRKALQPHEVGRNRERETQKQRLDRLNNNVGRRGAYDEAEQARRPGQLEAEIATGSDSQNEREDKALPGYQTKVAPDSLYDDRDPNTRRIDEVLIEHDVTNPQRLNTALTAYERGTDAAVPPPLPARSEPLDPKPAPEPPIFKGPQPEDVSPSPFRRDAQEGQDRQEGRGRPRPDQGEIRPSSYQQPGRKAPEAPQPPPKTEAPRTQPTVSLPRQAPAYPQPSQVEAPPPLLAPPPPGLPQPATEAATALREQLASDAALSPQTVQALTNQQFLAQVPPQAAAAIAQRLLAEAPKLASSRQLPTLDELVRPRTAGAQPPPQEAQQKPAPEASAEQLAARTPAPDPQSLALAMSQPTLSARDAEVAYAQLQRLDAPQLEPYVKEVMGGYVPPPIGGKDEKQHYLDMLKEEMDSRLRANQDNPRPVARPNSNYVPEPADEAQLLRTGYQGQPAQQEQQQRPVESQGTPTVLSSVPQEDHDPKLLSMQLNDAVYDRDPKALAELFGSASRMPEDQLTALVQDITGSLFRPQAGRENQEVLLAELRDWAVKQGIPDGDLTNALVDKKMTDGARNLEGALRSDEDLMRMFGVPQGASVRQRGTVGPIKDMGLNTVGHGVEVQFEHPAFVDMVRAFGVDRDGAKFMRNIAARIKPEYRGTGLMTDMLHAQALQGQASDFSYVSADAVSNSGEDSQGGNVLPKLGFDATVEQIREQSPAYAREIVTAFPNARSLSDVVAAPGGREWLKQNGKTVKNLRLDLSPDSVGWQVIDAIKKAKDERSKQ